MKNKIECHFGVGRISSKDIRYSSLKTKENNWRTLFVSEYEYGTIKYYSKTFVFTPELYINSYLITKYTKHTQ